MPEEKQGMSEEMRREIRSLVRDELAIRIGNERLLFQKDIIILDGRTIKVGANTGTKFGTATTEKIGFHNATPVAQRSGAAQDAVATTGATNTTPYGYSTSGQANAIVTLVNELRAALVAKGLIKGAV